MVIVIHNCMALYGFTLSFCLILLFIAAAPLVLAADAADVATVSSPSTSARLLAELSDVDELIRLEKRRLQILQALQQSQAIRDDAAHQLTDDVLDPRLTSAVDEYGELIATSQQRLDDLSAAQYAKPHDTTTLIPAPMISTLSGAGRLIDICTAIMSQRATRTSPALSASLLAAAYVGEDGQCRVDLYDISVAVPSLLLSYHADESRVDAAPLVAVDIRDHSLLVARRDGSFQSLKMLISSAQSPLQPTANTLSVNLTLTAAHWPSKDATTSDDAHIRDAKLVGLPQSPMVITVANNNTIHIHSPSQQVQHRDGLSSSAPSYRVQHISVGAAITSLSSPPLSDQKQLKASKRWSGRSQDATKLLIASSDDRLTVTKLPTQTHTREQTCVVPNLQSAVYDVMAPSIVWVYHDAKLSQITTNSIPPTASAGVSCRILTSIATMKSSATQLISTKGYVILLTDHVVFIYNTTATVNRKPKLVSAFKHDMAAPFVGNVVAVETEDELYGADDPTHTLLLATLDSSAPIRLFALHLPYTDTTPSQLSLSRWPLMLVGVILIVLWQMYGSRSKRNGPLFNSVSSNGVATGLSGLYQRFMPTSGGGGGDSDSEDVSLSALAHRIKQSRLERQRESLNSTRSRQRSSEKSTDDDPAMSAVVYNGVDSYVAHDNDDDGAVSDDSNFDEDNRDGGNDLADFDVDGAMDQINANEHRNGEFEQDSGAGDEAFDDDD